MLKKTKIIHYVHTFFDPCSINTLGFIKNNNNIYAINI